MDSPNMKKPTRREICYLCKVTIWSNEPRENRQKPDGTPLGMRHKRCAIKGQCPHCDADVIVGEGLRTKVGSDYWHSTCYKNNVEEAHKREAEETRQAEEKNKQEEPGTLV